MGHLLPHASLFFHHPHCVCSPDSSSSANQGQAANGGVVPEISEWSGGRWRYGSSTPRRCWALAAHRRWRVRRPRAAPTLLCSQGLGSARSRAGRRCPQAWVWPVPHAGVVAPGKADRASQAAGCCTLFRKSTFGKEDIRQVSLPPRPLQGRVAAVRAKRGREDRTQLVCAEGESCGLRGEGVEAGPAPHHAIACHGYEDTDAERGAGRNRQLC